MHKPTLYIGDLVRLKGTNVHGVVMNIRRIGIYDIHVFKDNHTLTFPRGMLKKIETDTFCP